jgi:hypothetical protein
VLEPTPGCEVAERLEPAYELATDTLGEHIRVPVPEFLPQPGER